MAFSDQSRFEECYRGRQSSIHHMAYMRMAKVLGALYVLNELKVDLSHKSIFDYGFGAGTLFRYCPRDSYLYGVEQDTLNVGSVTQMLKERGYSHVDLQSLEIASWQEHPLLARKYDVIVCSHVLEHMPEPEQFLSRIAQCLEPKGIFLGLVPINERVMNKHHVSKVDRELIKQWVNQPGLKMTCYREFDPVMYWLQPMFNHDTGIYHKMAQILSIGLGVPASALGPSLWHNLQKIASGITFSKPTQAAFIMQLDDAPNNLLSSTNSPT